MHISDPVIDPSRSSSARAPAVTAPRPARMTGRLAAQVACNKSATVATSLGFWLEGAVR